MSTVNNVAGIVDSDSEDEELNAEGQAMKDLLKRQKADDVLEEKKKGNSDSDGEEEGKKESTDGEYVIKHDLGGNIIRVKVETPEVPTLVTAKGEKRTHDQVGGSAAGPSKLQKTTAAESSKASGLSEKALQQQLSRYGGRMRTRDLIKKFKKYLKTADDKALFRDIIRTICDVEDNVLDGRVLVLKKHFM